MHTFAAVVRAYLQVCALASQVDCDIGLLAGHCHQQRRAASLVVAVQPCVALLHQHHSSVVLASAGCTVQRRAASLVLGVHLGACLDQEPHYADEAFAGLHSYSSRSSRIAINSPFVCDLLGAQLPSLAEGIVDLPCSAQQNQNELQLNCQQHSCSMVLAVLHDSPA